MPTTITGLSGNEIFCLHRKGLLPGELVIGNSVYSMGMLGSVGSSIRTLAGGEVKAVTDMIQQGRHLSYRRMLEDAQRHGADGITGVTSELVFHANNIEFLSIGSGVRLSEQAGGRVSFSSSGDAQELYCTVDAGFQPMKFVFGNVAYAIGFGGGLMATFRSLKRGEVKEYSQMFNQTRRLALDRLLMEARQAGANAVVGIRTSIMPFQQIQEMVMLGTACRHDGLPADSHQMPYSCDLTPAELWNLASMGIAPLRSVLGASVYSLGVIGGLTSALKSMARGEINELTTLIYEAREQAIAHIARDAQACGADDVAGIKIYVYELGQGFIEILAIGTAVKRLPNVRTTSEQLPVQAVMDDKKTFVNLAEMEVGSNLNRPGGVKTQSDSKKTVKSGLDILGLILRLLAG